MYDIVMSKPEGSALTLTDSLADSLADALAV